MQNTTRFFNKNTIASVFGNTLEWYDFVLYASLAPFIAKHFFPASNSFASLMLTFGVLAVGFIMRPLGGFIYGHFGDLYGRRKSLLYSIIMMAIPTICIGLVPDYATIGIMAPILILLIRLFQGLAVGGEFAGSMVYLGEISDKQNRTYFASFSMFGIYAGLLFGPIAIKLTEVFVSHDAFAAWGWRIPFLLSIILATAVYLLRKNMSESVEFEKTSHTEIKNFPIGDCFRSYKAAMLICCGIAVQVGIPFWLVIVYSTTYISKILHAPFSTAISMSLISIIIGLIVIPLAGQLSKK